jgi:hypothetical protein
MFTIVCIFFGFGSFLSFKTIKPKIILENTINAQLFSIQTNLIFFAHLKT